MKNLIFIILLLSQITIAQEWKLQESVPLKADSFVGVDSYKYLYWIKDNVLYKQEGESTYSFNNKLLGSIQSDRKSTRLNSSHVAISYAVFCLKKQQHGKH